MVVLNINYAKKELSINLYAEITDKCNLKVEQIASDGTDLLYFWSLVHISRVLV